MYYLNAVLVIYLGVLLITVSIACNDYLVSGPDGRGTGGISNDQISASSFLHIGLEPWKSRLNATVESHVTHFGGWMPSSTDNSSYIQAEFGDLCEIREVATLGRYNVENWVEEYTVSYSVDGNAWVTVNDSAGPVLFPANTNSSEVVALNSLSPPFHAKYVRLHPTQWRNSLALRFDLVGCCNSTDIPHTAPTTCRSALVTKSYGVRNSQITASSFFESFAVNEGYEPWAGRLEANNARCNSYWAVSDTTDAYVQVDFRRITNIYCIVTMGHMVWYVESYNVQYSMDGSIWHSVLDVFGNVKLFAGNDGHGDSETTRCLPEPLVARYVRIQIISFNNALLLKFDFIGCNATNDVLDIADDLYEGQYCLNYLSSGNNPVWDESFTASSFFTTFATEPWMARLTSNFGWAPVSLGFGEYIQVDLHFRRIVRAIIIDGCTPNYHVRTFYVAHSNDGANFNIIMDTGSLKLFPGNDGEDYADDYVMFPEAIFTRYIRIYPYTYCGHKCMSFDVLGCSNDTAEHIENVTCSYAGSPCDTYLITELSLSDESFSASSTRGAFLEPWNSRYNSTHGWCARSDDYHKYIQVDLQTEHIVTCIVTRSAVNLGTTRSYYIQYYNGVNWVDAHQLIPGNYNDDNTMKRSLPDPVYTRYLRLLPYTGTGCLRFDILGCRNNSEEFIPETKSVCQHDGNVCNTSLMQYVDDANITASSAIEGFEPEMGRLDSNSSWMSAGSSEQFIQVDFGTQVNITCITMTGNRLDKSHVRSYYLYYNSEGDKWSPYQDSHQQPKLFPANDLSNHGDTVTRHLQRPLYAMSIRIIPVTYFTNMSLRFEVIGCGFPTTATSTTTPTSTTTTAFSTQSMSTSSTTTQFATTTSSAALTTTTQSSTTSTTITTVSSSSTSTMFITTTQPTSSTMSTASEPSTTSTTTMATTTQAETTVSTQPTSTASTTQPISTTMSTTSDATSTSTTTTAMTTQTETTVSSQSTSTASTTTQPISTTMSTTSDATLTSTTTMAMTTQTSPASTTTQPISTTMSTTSTVSTSTTPTTTELATTSMTSTSTQLTTTTAFQSTETTTVTALPPLTLSLVDNITSQYYMMPNSVAVCTCKCSVISNISLEIGSLQLAKKIEQLINATKVSKNETKVTLMKKISAPDHRQSAYTMGALGVSILSITMGVLVMLDVSKIICSTFCK